MKVGISFCGGCNPRIDRVGVAEEIKKYLLARGVSVAYNTPDADFIVYVGGCSSSCAARYAAGDKPCVVIAGTGVDCLAVDADQLSAIVIEKMGDYLEKLERSL